MSVTGWGLIVFFVLLSGALAYWGDVVGRKLGKKRLTFGRLRPRHTAAIMTALFGMLGSAVAIGALLWASKPVAAMLFEFDKIRHETVRLNGELSRARADLGRSQHDLDLTKGQVATEKGHVAEEKGKLADAQKSVASLTSLANTLKVQAASIRKQVQSIRGQLAALKVDYDRVKKEKTTAEGQMSYAQSELQKIQKEDLDIRNEVREKTNELGDLQKKFDGLSGDYAKLQGEYETQAQKARDDIKGLQKQVDDAKSELDNAKSDLAKLYAEAAKIMPTVNASRTQPLIYSRNDELARVAVRTSLNGAEARSTIMALLDQASTAASNLGAKPAPGSMSAAVIPDGKDNKGNIVTEEMQVQDLVRRLSNQNRDQVVIANSVFNAFVGEPVAVIVRILPNPVVYKQNQIIVETRIDGQMTQDQIVQAITKFVQETLGPTAVKDGLIPAVGQPNPLGEINQEDLFKLVADIKSRPFTSRVKFIAAQDIRAGDKLKLEFRVS